jgi:hypothetical protein
MLWFRLSAGAALCLTGCATSPNRDFFAYECSTDTVTWVQKKPCPASVSEPHAVRMDAPDGGYSIADYRVDVPVRESKLAREQLCIELARDDSRRPSDVSGLWDSVGCN